MVKNRGLFRTVGAPEDKLDDVYHLTYMHSYAVRRNYPDLARCRSIQRLRLTIVLGLKSPTSSVQSCWSTWLMFHRNWVY